MQYVWVGAETKPGYVYVVFLFFLGRELRQRPEQMARRLEEETHGSWASARILLGKVVLLAALRRPHFLKA